MLSKEIGMEFAKFPKIERLEKLFTVVTQKLHGTNASVHITQELFSQKYTVRAGSRERFITPEDDNYGFARFVKEHEEEFIRCLGQGVHYGEWAGPGINSGEGLSEKTFFLFDAHRFPTNHELPPRCKFVPTLYAGPFCPESIELVKKDLRDNGSKVAPGFMRPEGVVIHLLNAGARFKVVFAPEETQWTRPAKPKTQPTNLPDVQHLLQPIRLEKLLSRDEKYLREMPSSLPEIVSAYVADLAEEGQLDADEDARNLQKKALGKILFSFAKQHIRTLGLVSPE
jgi:hypothetical protein